MASRAVRAAPDPLSTLRHAVGIVIDFRARTKAKRPCQLPKILTNLSVACLFSNRRALGLCREPGRCCCQYLAGRPGRVFSYGLTGAVCTIVRREIKENPAATNVSSFAERTFLVGGGVLRIYSNLDLGAEFHHLSCGHAEEGC